jgi:hypothetical protein
VLNQLIISIELGGIIKNETILAPQRTEKVKTFYTLKIIDNLKIPKNQLRILFKIKK